MKWTKKQEEAINEKGDILVAAAAGSGKTAVLVERNIRKIIDEKIDIHRILAITFTSAASSEMRERILLSLYKELEKNDNTDIRRQISLLPKANISTIHSFCFNIIKENFFNLDLSADVSIVKEEELDILKQQALDEVLEEEYLKKDENFVKLLNIYSEYKSDDNLRKEILRIYNFLESIPFKKEWFKEILEYNLEKSDDYSKTFHGQIILKEVKEIILGNIAILENQKKLLSRNFELEKYSNTISEDINKLEKIITLNKWDEIYEYLNSLKFDRWPTDRKITDEAKDIAKDKRDVVKKDIANIKTKYIREHTEGIIQDNLDTIENIVTLFNLSFLLEERYSEIKNSKNVIDFSDLEKLTLQLLVRKEGDQYIKTDIAKEISKKYVEIQVDEYQDINLMQELIIWSISRNNVFRVGDLKQSIYKFRNANPDIFLEKYNTYLSNEEKEGDSIGTKILLYQNFRSRKNVIDFCNDLFNKIMSKDLGEIEYNEKEFLNFAADYDDTDITTDIDIISKLGFDKKRTDSDEFADEYEDLDLETKEFIEDAEDLQIEAYHIADKIKELIDSGFQINDKKEGLRDIEYRDIVILLRSSVNKAELIEKVLYQKGIPVYADSSSDFFSSYEVALVISLLKIIDNPLLDIDLVSVLRSFFGGFSLNEITKIRRINTKSSFYQALLDYINEENNPNIDIEIRNKVENFLKLLKKLKDIEKYLGITELLTEILINTGYINFIALENNGELKKANLQLFLARGEEYEANGNLGLHRFINFLEKLEVGQTDIASAKIIGEKENVVRIMTIHSSKGLEFPVVFLSNAYKRANIKDLSEIILLNNKYGIGSDFVDFPKRLRYPTLIKEAIKIKLKEELIAEEMRVLYVALTRAREKLIITGTVKDGNKYLKDIRELSDTYSYHSDKEIRYLISPYIIKKHTRYLDWIMLAEPLGLSSSKVQLISAKDLEFDENEEKREILKFDENDFDEKTIINANKVIELLKYEYKTESLNYTKVAASRVGIDDNQIIEENIRNITMKKPNFMKTTKISKAEIGSFTHLFLQKLDFNKVYNIQELKDELDKLVDQELILPEEAETINLQSILNFVHTDEYIEIIESRQEKEKQFIAKFSIEEIKEILDVKEDANNLSDESILVQGMIDLYYITKDDKINILDYKTDNINNIEELKDRYRVQMLIYKKALEKALGKEVDKVLIYSTQVNKYIEI